MARPVALIETDFPTFDEVAETYNISSSRRKKLDAFIMDYLNNQASGKSKAEERAMKASRKTASKRAVFQKRKR